MIINSKRWIVMTKNRPIKFTGYLDEYNNGELTDDLEDARLYNNKQSAENDRESMGEPDLFEIKMVDFSLFV